MKLAIFERTKLTKGEVKRLRREGNVPAVSYGSGKSVRHLYLRGADLQAILRDLPKGALATTIFELQESGASYRALVKGIQYNVVTYAVEHVDFLMVDDKTPVTVNVPIQVVGAADCPGLKLGGTLRQVIRTMKVECLPKHIPHAFQIDVRSLSLAQAKRLSDIEVPAHVRPVARMEQVAIVIAKQ